MPLFEFSCDKCGHQMEILLLLNDELPFCPKCSGPMTKLMSAPGLLAMGSTNHEKWLNSSYKPQGVRPKNKPLPPGVKIYDMEFGHQERELLARKSEMDNM